MKRFKRKEKFYKKLLNSKLFLLFVIFVTFLSLKALVGAYGTYNQSKMRLESVQDKHTELQNRAESITSDLEYLQSNTGKEQEIRSRFNYAKEGEKAIFIIQNEEVEVTVPAKKNFWQKTINFFGL